MGFSRNIKVQYEMIAADVQLTSTKLTVEDDLCLLCTGSAEAPHPAVKPVWDPFCPSCDKTVSRYSLVKGKETATGFVPFTAAEVEALKAEDLQYKGILSLTAHPVSEVDGKTMPSGTSYYLAPRKGDRFYGVIREMIASHPEQTVLGLYTVNSRSAFYRVKLWGDALVAEQLLRPEELLPAPEVHPFEQPEQMLEMAREMAAAVVRPFDPASYRNTYAERLHTAMVEREATSEVAPATGTDDLMAQMASLIDSVAKQRAKKTSVPKQRAKKAPAKKAAPVPKKKPVRKAS